MGIRKMLLYESQLYREGATLLLIDGQGGGRGPLASFLSVFVFCPFTSNRLAGDTYICGIIGGWVTGGSRAQECLRKKSKYK